MTTRSVLTLIKGFHMTSSGRDLYRELIKNPSWPFIFRKLRSIWAEPNNSKAIEGEDIAR